MKYVFNTKTVTFFVAASACGVTGYLLYLLLKKDTEDDEYQNGLLKRNKQVIEISVPKELVNAFIGRNGKIIAELQRKSGTQINITDKTNGDSCICIIIGTKDACINAQSLIKEFIENQPIIECVDMWVPQVYFGKVIGRCGEQIFEISSRSGAKINVSSTDVIELNRRIILKGTQEQINIAKSLINEIIENCQKAKLQMDLTLAKREPRTQPKSPSPILIVETPQVERLSLVPGQMDSQFDVYISAMIDPSHFWLQIVGPKATELDQLVEDMTEYYQKPDNRDLHLLNSVSAGDLVAVILRFDMKWYRAEVLNVSFDENEEPLAELYYVDYGDTDILPCKEIYELRTDFLRLNFQAIECYLANVDPIGNDWTEEACDKFEEWTHVAQWKKLSARMNGCLIRDKTRAKRESSPIPGIDLFDVNNDRDINIAQELVNHGYAVFKKNSEVASMSNSNISADSNY